MAKEKKYAWPLVGNKKVVSFLEKSLQNNKLTHCYIFCGQKDLGKSTIAQYFAYNILYPDQPTAEELAVLQGDLHILEREEDKKNISIEQVREFTKTLSRGSFLSAYKVGIIKEAECLSEEASNALLKSLEEPTQKTIIILTVSSLDKLLPTIVSRGQILYFYPVSREEIFDYLLKNFKVTRSAAQNISALSLGRPVLAVKLLEDKEYYEVYQIKAKAVLNLFEQNLVSRLAALDSWFSKKSGREAVNIALDFIELLEGITRDFMLLSNNQNDILQHGFLGQDLKKIISEVIRKKGGQEYLLNIFAKIQEARTYLAANVNPRSVLDNVLIYL